MSIVNLGPSARSSPLPLAYPFCSPLSLLLFPLYSPSMPASQLTHLRVLSTNDVCMCVSVSLSLSLSLHICMKLPSMWAGCGVAPHHMSCTSGALAPGSGRGICPATSAGDSVQGRVTARRATPFTWLPLRAAEGQGRSPPKSQDGPEDFGFCIGREHCQGERRQLSELEA